ncbi:kinase domain protein (macronuclear) [Tetrahymena thermophila SB210]|uniref:Kinase domain protein n=1 Tax=Tetrahymena thermophila (strain SB210) TaxID=312017 RepID=Q241R8_TETTS|nr:kinase domain protein [Tetrahymena thermophila SB210]EAS02502.3 kinase domain protein [Tetrahymena thermophila SB210]|eukprot:XP_001022747.3 kinase domain protein [Tetrahymena thermophila SB210]
MYNLNQEDPCLQRELMEYLYNQNVRQQKLAQLNFQHLYQSFSKKVSEYNEDEIYNDQKSLATIMMIENNLPIIKKDLEQMGYQSISLISAGIQSFVVRALNTRNQQRCAIKCIRTKYKQLSSQEIENQIQQEVECFKQCRNSSNVVKLIHSQQCEEFTYLVFQECQKSLQHLLADNQNKFSEIAVVKYSMNVAQGLYDAQVKNCSVLDLKPENILIDQFGNALISKFVLDVQSSLESKVIVGNSPYKAPESAELIQMPRDMNASKRESFSLGMLIYRMLITGENQFEEKLQKVFSEKKVILENELNEFRFRSLLERLVLDLTKFEPEDRISIKDALCILKGIFSQYLEIGLESTQVFSGDITEVQDRLKESLEFTQISESQYSPILLKPLQDVLNENSDWLNASYVLKNSKLFQQTVQQRYDEYLNDINDLKQQIEVLNEQIHNQQNEINHMKFLSDVRNKKLNFCTFIQVEEEIKNFEEDQIRQYALEKANTFLEILKTNFKWTSFVKNLDYSNDQSINQ